MLWPLFGLDPDGPWWELRVLKGYQGFEPWYQQPTGAKRTAPPGTGWGAWTAALLTGSQAAPRLRAVRVQPKKWPQQGKRG
ncbi:hypothetical protein TIFTF001_037016 [Ficus carica]|uniref:Uncharacterized protein n=1 Tax=Ficus carica TaxID=3494 RepID=A0AA88JDB0_FICCA|nr:hypothetical protein TIFTF001_037016 [Ficus carica]